MVDGERKLRKIRREKSDRREEKKGRCRRLGTLEEVSWESGRNAVKEKKTRKKVEDERGAGCR